MNHRATTVVLGIGLAFALALLLAEARGVRPPGNRQGYEPDQPIAYSHQLHAGELKIPCLYCHSGAERSKHAGIPAASTCMNCHQFVTATRATQRAEDEAAAKENRPRRRVVSPELRKLYDSLGLDEELRPKPGVEPRSIEWNRVHLLPDFVVFDHRAHVAAGVTCQTCHGPVETMRRVRQVESLSMGWCVECHRQANRSGVGGKPVRASTDCATCHH